MAWEIDNSHSQITFTVRHMVFAKVRGSFKSWTAKLDLEEDVAKSAVEVSIDANSIDTNEPKRDGHLRSADFFDAETFPTLLFKSKKVEKKGDNLAILGDLTIRGVTREVTLDAEETGRGKDPWGQPRIAFAAHTTIKRGDWGLKWNQALEAGGVLVGEDVRIDVDVEAVRKA
ncbi:MAG: YceI family protein [Polyangiales bacterium]